jgi:hypothetical protein
LRLLGLPIEPPQAVVNRVLSDLGSIARLARAAPAQLDRILELGEEIAGIGRGVLEIAERLDRRAEAIMALGERLDRRTVELIELGADMRELGHRIDVRGAEIVDGASRVVETGGELITVLPALERAPEMATPLEGAIDRFGRLVDRLPGGTARRRAEQSPGTEPAPTQAPTPEPTPTHASDPVAETASTPGDSPAQPLADAAGSTSNADTSNADTPNADTTNADTPNADASNADTPGQAER